MLDPDSLSALQSELVSCMVGDQHLLSQLRSEISPLRSGVHRIQPRATTSISLVGTDGGNNSLQFDPFLVQLIRVVDSSNNEYCLEAITPTTDITRLSARQFNGHGQPVTPLGEMMAYLDVTDLTHLSHMIRKGDHDRPVSPSWVQVYREIIEWAILFSIIKNKEFGTDTLIVFDGLLRSKVFSGDLFKRLLEGIDQSINQHRQRHRRNIYLVGIAKHSKVLARYRLAMALEHILTCSYPAYVEIPREIEEKAYVWNEYARGNDREGESGEINKYVGGKMFFVKFGPSQHDPIWPIDIFQTQCNLSQTIIGSLLADAYNGFPVPFYPLCLQKAHENSALVDFDFTILQDYIFDGIRTVLGTDAQLLDIFRMQEADPSQRRYQ